MSARRGMAWLAAGLLAAAAGARAAGPAAAAPQDPEHLLDAIRQALVASATAAPVRVQSFAWVDTEGRLHESSQFTSDTRVRAVRLPSLFAPRQADAPAQVQVQVQADVLPAGVGPRAPTDPQQCLQATGRWRQGLQVESSAGASLSAASPGLAQQLARQAGQAFLAAAADSRRWRAAARAHQPSSTYEQHLLGRDADRVDWLARLEVESGAGGLALRVEAREADPPSAARSVRVPLSGTTPADVAAASAEAVARLDRQGACDPLWFRVAGGGDALRLREGTDHGLRAGDRLLLVAREHLPSRLLEPGAVRAIALVQAGAPGPQGTPLRWLAGPRPAEGAAAGDWVALPL